MRNKKYIWLPALLLIYGGAMAAWFGPELIAGGRTKELILICAFDLLICILLYIFLRKKQRLSNRH